MIDWDIIEDYYYGDCCEWDNGEGTNLYLLFSICEKKCIHEKMIEDRSILSKLQSIHLRLIIRGF